MLRPLSVIDGSANFLDYVDYPLFIFAVTE